MVIWRWESEPGASGSREQAGSDTGGRMQDREMGTALQSFDLSEIQSNNP